MNDKLTKSDLDGNYQLIVSICKLAAAYHNAAVEKIDHIFFRGAKTTFSPELITFLKTRKCSQAITTSEWSNLLESMGYDPDQQINDFEEIEINPGQGTLAENIATYAQKHPDQSVYMAIDAILKDYSKDPVLEILATSFQKPEAEIKTLFAMAYHHLDTMYPLEAELNILAVYYEPKFEQFRDTTQYKACAKILGKLNEEIEKLPPKNAEIASQFILSRTNQLREYAHLNMSQSNIAASIQALSQQLSSEYEYLHTQLIATQDVENTNAIFHALLRPELVWLEQKILSLEMSSDMRERQKGARIHAAYNNIPPAERSNIGAEMSRADLKPDSLVGRLKHAMNESTAYFPMLSTFTQKADRYHLSHEFNEQYQNYIQAGIDSDTTDSLSNDSDSSNDSKRSNSR